MFSVDQSEKFGGSFIMARPKGQIFSATIGDVEITFETEVLAQQAGGSVVVRSGDCMLLITATASKTARENIDFLPLSVEFEEKLYAAGRIPGSWLRREGRPSEEAVLTARLIDRPLRPLFDSSIRNEIQVIVMALSADGDTNLDMMAINGASAALMISDIPWNGPVGAVRIGMINHQLIVNPSVSEMKRSQLDLRVVGTREAILMVEASAEEVDEKTVIDALRVAHDAIQGVIDLQLEMQQKIGKKKQTMIQSAILDGVQEKVNHWLADKTHILINTTGTKSEQNKRRNELRDELIEAIADGESISNHDVSKAYDIFYKDIMRERVLNEGIRPDGRHPNQIRQIWCDVQVLPRAHGDGVFTRGETQVLSITTLGTPEDEQRLDSLGSQDTKRYIHHYNFPPYSVGETGRISFTSRREIGHGALAERAIVPIMPTVEEFPYTVRVVSEVLGSNGSSSMASVCGSTLALMDAGVPIKSPVSGIAMGLITDPNNGRFTILSDIQGLEDALGDMDLKVAGTRNGITALQMDIKIKGIKWNIFEQALAQAQAGRYHILDVMQDTIRYPREELSPNAPSITTIHIDPEKIGKVIGPGGKVIRSIQEETGTKISIDDDGTVFITSGDQVSARNAQTRVEELTATAEIGMIYTGKVVRVADFGVIVEILPSITGMVHVSQLADYRVESPSDIVSFGDEIMVMVTDISHDGKIRLSRQAVLEGWTLEEARMRDRVGGRRRPSSHGRPDYDRRSDYRQSDRRHDGRRLDRRSVPDRRTGYRSSDRHSDRHGSSGRHGSSSRRSGYRSDRDRFRRSD